MYSDVWFVQHHIVAVELFPDRHISHFGAITCPARWPDLAVPDYFLCGYIRNKVYGTHPANIDDLEQWICEAICKEILQHVMTAVPSWLQECIWTAWWAPTKCRIQTIMIQMNSHVHGMYLPVLIKFFHFALKCYLISKTVRGFWCTLYFIKNKH
jgi:hypothetical protein